MAMIHGVQFLQSKILPSIHLLQIDNLQRSRTTARYKALLWCMACCKTLAKSFYYHSYIQYKIVYQLLKKKLRYGYIGVLCHRKSANEEMIKAKWLSLTNHIHNVHRGHSELTKDWEEGGNGPFPLSSQ